MLLRHSHPQLMIDILLATLEARIVHAPLLSAAKLTQLLQGGHFNYDPQQRAAIQYELTVRAAVESAEVGTYEDYDNR